MIDHQTRSSHLSVVPYPPDAGNVHEITERAGARLLTAETAAPIAVAELTRSSDHLVVLTSLADKLLGMGYDCLIDVVSGQCPRWTITRGIPDGDVAVLQQVAPTVQDEPLTLSDGTFVGVGFHGPAQDPDSLLLATPSRAQDVTPTAPGDIAPGMDRAAASSGPVGGAGEDANAYGCAQSDSEFVGAVVVRRPRAAATAADAEVVHSVVDHALGIVAAERLREQLDRQRNRVQHLEQALSTNREIGVAIGILMAGRRCGAEEAFALLRSVSQNSNRKIRDIAAQIAYTGELPPIAPKRTAETARESLPVGREPAASKRSDAGRSDVGRSGSGRSGREAASVSPGASQGSGRENAGRPQPGTRGGVRELPLRPQHERSW